MSPLVEFMFGGIGASLGFWLIPSPTAAIVRRIRGKNSVSPTPPQSLNPTKKNQINIPKFIVTQPRWGGTGGRKWFSEHELRFTNTGGAAYNIQVSASFQSNSFEMNDIPRGGFESFKIRFEQVDPPETIKLTLRCYDVDGDPYQQNILLRKIGTSYEQQ